MTQTNMTRWIPLTLSGASALVAVGLAVGGLSAIAVAVAIGGSLLAIPLWLRITASGQSTAADEASAAAQQLEQAQTETARLKEQLQVLQAQWIPTLSGQLVSVKGQMEDAIVQLTSSFSEIHQGLGLTASLAGDAAGTLSGSGSGLADKVENSLREMLGSINKALEEKVSMFEEVNSFISSTDELARMASSVEDLAAKTNLLALNAAIEAARAGEDGRGFSIVADEVRKLSMLSAETGQQIRRRVQDISASARRAGEGASRMQVSDGKLLGYAKNTVDEVVGSFQSVTEPLRHTSQQIVENTSQITNGLNNAVVNFQFQDRVSQIISHVEESLEALQSQIASRRTLDVTELMDKLSRKYTMAEERINHAARVSNGSGAARPAAAPAKASGDVDITFF